MKVINFQKKIVQLPVQTDQTVQFTFLFNQSEIALFFEDHIQVWNLDTIEKIASTKHRDQIGYWAQAVPISQTSFAFVQQSEEGFLGIYNFNGHKIQKLCNIEDSERIQVHKLIYLEKTQNIVIHISNQQNKILTWNNKKLIQTDLKDNMSVAKYGNDSVVVFDEDDNQLNFEIYQGEKVQKYSLNLKKRQQKQFENSYQICSIKKYSPTEAIIGLYDMIDTMVVIFSLKSQKLIKYERKEQMIPTKLLNIFGVWIVADAQIDDYQSQVKIGRCFSSDTSTIQIDRLYQGQNTEIVPFLSIENSDQYQQNPVCRLQIIRGIVDKKVLYIKFLQEIDLISEFGSQIVKYTINNLI